MSRPLGPTFRIRAVRDAFGLVRLLFMMECDGTDLDRPAALVDIGQELVLALDLGRCGRDSLGYGAGVNRAVNVMDKLAAMTWPSEVAALVRVAYARVATGRAVKTNGTRSARPSQREGRRGGRGLGGPAQA